MEDLVFRYQWESYMKIPESTPEYALIGEGFTSLSESKNSKEYTRKYVHDKTERTDVIGYSPSIAYSCDKISGDPVVNEVVKIHDDELVGSDARREIVSVNLWETAEGENTYRARKRTFAVIPSNKGDGTDALIYTGTMKACSDFVPGTFNRATKQFVPDTAASGNANSDSGNANSNSSNSPGNGGN